MIARAAARLATIALLLAVAGCGTSAQPHFYTLDSVATADGAPESRISVMVGPVSVPSTVDQPQFVVQVAPNRVDVDEFDRWASPLADGIARAVAGDLSVLLASPNVASAPFAGFTPEYRVTINIQRFESVKGGSALIDAVWAVRSAASGKAQSGRTVACEPVQGDGFDALAAAHSRALARLSGDIAAAIRADAAGSS